MNKITTPEQFMIVLNWNRNDLRKAIIMLNEWDQRKRSSYSSKLIYKVDMAEKEHLRNCVNFWKERLENET